MNCSECRYKLPAYQVCKDCNKELNLKYQSLKTSFEKLLLELNQLKEKERGHLDTIHRRNMQIKELKKQLAETIEWTEDIYGNRERYEHQEQKINNR